MAFSKIGNWRIVSSLVGNMSKDIKNIQLENLRKLGLLAEKKAVMHIQKQDLNWEALKPATKKAKTTDKKGKRRRSGKILIDTSSYFSSITSWVDEKGVVYAGVKREAKHKESGEVIANIAAVHEYGSKTRNIPARPLWRPVEKEMKGEVGKKKGFVNSVIEHFRRKYK